METNTDRTTAAEARFVEDRAAEIGLSPRQLRNFLALIGLPEPSGCRRWQGAHNDRGWGKYHGTGAHRFAYLLFVGPIPEGLTVDHVVDRGCVHRDCMEPAHLETVTVADNVLRGEGPTARNAQKDECDNGHPFDEGNTYWHTRNGRPVRACRRCKHDAYMRRRYPDRTTAAEARFIEEGHYAVLDHDATGPHIRVVSETLGHRGIAYLVRVATAGPGQPLIFDCAADGPVGRDGHAPLSCTDGRPLCKHAAGAARRLHREGFAVPVLPGVHGTIATRDTRWIAAPVVATSGPVLVDPDRGSVDPNTMERRQAVRRSAMRAAAEGPGGDPFAGFPGGA